MGSFLSFLGVESGFLGSVMVGWSFLSCSVGLSDSVAGLGSGAVDDGSGLGLGSSFVLSSPFFFLSDFLDLVDLPFARELAISVAVSRGNGVFGSTFLTTRNDARTVFPPGNQSKIVNSGKR